MLNKDGRCSPTWGGKEKSEIERQLRIVELGHLKGEQVRLQAGATAEVVRYWSSGDERCWRKATEDRGKMEKGRGCPAKV